MSELSFRLGRETRLRKCNSEGAGKWQGREGGRKRWKVLGVVTLPQVTNQNYLGKNGAEEKPRGHIQGTENGLVWPKLMDDVRLKSC